MALIRRKGKILFIPLVMLVLMISIKGSMAYYTSSSDAANKFIAGDVNIEIKEEWEHKDSWDGKIKDKKVKIQNETDTDTLVRVSITPRWIKEDETPFSGDVSSNTITLNFTENLKDMPTENYWVKGEDGYYYYLKKLTGNTETTELLSSVSIKEDIVLPEEYKDKILTVDVKAEAIQATNHDIDGDGINEYQYENVWIGVDEDISVVLKNILDK